MAHADNKEGIILVDKPKGITSHDVVDIIRRRLGMRRVGHAGTLDPMAEGLLVVLVGKSTKLFSRFVSFDKEYLGVMKLGEITSTGDSEGELIKKQEYSGIDEGKIMETFLRFQGEMDQIPPMVSALRVGGKRLYRLARKGVEIERKPRRIKIYSLCVRSINLPFVEFHVHCSKGTYVRKLAEDMGEILGCGAHMVKIKRLSVGPFKLEDAVSADGVDEGNLRAFAL